MKTRRQRNRDEGRIKESEYLTEYVHELNLRGDMSSLWHLSCAWESIFSIPVQAFTYNISYDNLWDGKSFIRNLPNVEGQVFSEANEDRVKTYYFFTKN